MFSHQGVLSKKIAAIQGVTQEHHKSFSCTVSLLPGCW